MSLSGRSGTAARTCAKSSGGPAIFPELFRRIHPRKHTDAPGETEKVAHAQFRHGQTEGLQFPSVFPQFGEGDLLFRHEGEALQIDAPNEDPPGAVLFDLFVETAVEDVAGQLKVGTRVGDVGAGEGIEGNARAADQAFFHQRFQFAVIAPVLFAVEEHQRQFRQLETLQGIRH